MSTARETTTEPKTKKGRSTKARLLQGARSVFGRSGYFEARVSDIAAAAGLSNGAFYRYYSDKRDILIDLLNQLVGDTYETSALTKWTPDEPLRSMQEGIELYLHFYRDHAEVFRVLHETAEIDPEVDQLHRQSRMRFQTRSVRWIQRCQDVGVMRHSLEPELAVAFLSGIIEHYAYARFVQRQYPERDIGEVVEAIMQLWAYGTFDHKGLPTELSMDGQER